MTILQQIEVKIHPYIRQGYMNLQTLGWKEVRIIGVTATEKEEVVNFQLESKFRETYNVKVRYDNIDAWLSNFRTIAPIKIVEVEKDIKVEQEDTKIGYTKIYKLFHQPPFKTLPPPSVIASIESLGNIIPITVIGTQNGKYRIVDGEKRYNYLKYHNLPIFYIDITSTINLSDLKDNVQLCNTIKLSSKKSTKHLWDSLSKRFTKYREIEKFIYDENVDTYINKIHLLALTCNLKWDNIINVKISISDVKDTYQKIIDYICENNIDLTNKENKKIPYIDFKNKIKRENIIQKLQLNDGCVVEYNFNKKSELIYVKYNNGFYNIQIIKNDNPENEVCIYPQIIDGGCYVEKVNILINTEDIIQYINTKKDILLTILSADILIENLDSLL